MRFFVLITLLALFQIQSQTAHADFICNDGRYPNAKVGYCAGHVHGPTYLVEPATLVNQVSGTFTCSQTTILGLPPTWRWCCSKSPTLFSTEVGPVTGADIMSHTAVRIQHQRGLPLLLFSRWPSGKR
ncbi:hypothetical protein VP01_3763g2 [Puccinia sorghi]|uniref:Uncharacterized protein n=1 Tax=Puccinia sorghi TaxID=27349 RepID=A0A0L6UTW3_9BASI|nr:hypothetical protein VP01_3763g2 [Puccinia sorghi]